MKKNDDLIDIATRAGNFGVFKMVLYAGGLKDSLKEKGPYTIFAPTDEAFAKVPAAKLDALLMPENKETLQLMLRNHIVPGKLMASELMRLDHTKTAKGEELKIESRAGLWVNEAKIISPDLEASNGVLHGIDTVLLPQTQVAKAG